MQVFPKIAKFIWLTLLLGSLFLFFMDFGKIYVTDDRNYFIARNAGTYVSKFSVDETELEKFDEKAKSLSVAKETLLKYFSTQYNNLGYELVYSGGGANNFKAVFYPKDNAKIELWEGPIFVRAKLYGFTGAPPSPLGGSSSLIRLNIEQKIPAGVRNLLLKNGIPMKSAENPINGKDFEGFIGYYSVESEYAFSINVVK